jgi:hypothetical protein
MMVEMYLTSLKAGGVITEEVLSYYLYIEARIDLWGPINSGR